MRPDLVILAFFVGNDFTDERRNDLHPWVETEPARLSYAFRLIRNLYRLWKARSFAREHLLDASEKQVFPRGGIDLRKRRPPTKSGHPPIKVKPDIEGWYLQMESRRIQICSRAKRQSFLKLAGDVAEILRRFAAEVRSSGAAFLLMIIPDEFQVNSTLQTRVLENLGIDLEDVELDLPQRFLRETLKEAQIDHLDLLPTFREHSKTRALYWPNNSH